MVSIELNVDVQDLYYFDKFLSKDLARPPFNSLHSSGSYDPISRSYQITYGGQIRKNKIFFVFEIRLSAARDKVNPLNISVESVSPERKISEKETEYLLNLIISRIRESEKNAKEKPLKTFEYEARLSTSFNPLKSTIEFGKYKLVPVEKRHEQGWECKLKFSVEAIDKDDSLTKATMEAKKIAAWLCLVFGTLIRWESFSEITTDPKPIIHFETIDRPDLRPVKRANFGEIKIPQDFMELWNNFYSLPQKFRESFVSSCLCYQVAMEMRMTHIPLSYQLFITAIEVVARNFVRGGPRKRFVEFVCQCLKQSDTQFKKFVGRFYARRSAILHEKGIGLGRISFGIIRPLEEIPFGEPWHLEIIVNAALIGFLKDLKNFLT